jgi:hypothetical protein
MQISSLDWVLEQHRLYTLPTIDDPELAMTGGGRFRPNMIHQSLRLRDDSSVYGRFDPARLTAQLATAGPPWDRLVLSVG